MSSEVFELGHLEMNFSSVTNIPYSETSFLFRSPQFTR